MARRLIAAIGMLVGGLLATPAAASDPEIISPLPGLVSDATPLGDGAIMTLRWTSPVEADVVDWAIYVGTEPGAWDIQRITHMNRYFLEDRPLEESLKIGIPADGSTFYVRLFWRAPGKGFHWLDQTYEAPDFNTEGDSFALNAGLNDAWFDPATSGQGMLVNVFPGIRKVFVALFTFDSEAPPPGATATLGGPGQRWLTGLGDIEGNRVELDVAYTTGGVFDSPEPAPNTDAGQGTLVLTFEDCKSGMLTYDLPVAGLQGSMPLQRVAPDNEPLCVALADGVVSDAERTSLPGELPTADAGFVINPGLNDAWFNPDTAGQGVLLSVLPDSQQLFLAKFTFDTIRPDEGSTAVIGGPGQRWFTAIGPIDGDRATLDVAYTTGGTFGAVSAEQRTDTGQGTVTIQFDDCRSATLTYDLPGASRQGSIPLQRLTDDNVALCEALTTPQ